MTRETRLVESQASSRPPAATVSVTGTREGIMFDFSDEAWNRAQHDAVRGEIERLTAESYDLVVAHRPATAAATAREALALAEANEDTVPTEALLFLGYALSDLHDHDAALDSFRLARDRFVVEQHRWGLANVDMNVGIVLAHLGRHDEAIELLEQASAVFTERGDQADVDACRINLVSALRAAGRRDEALAVGRQAVESARNANDQRLLADALTNWANGLVDPIDIETARVAYIEALDLYRKLHLPTEEAVCLDALGVLARRDGQYDFAASMHAQAISMYEGRDHAVQQAIARYHLAITEVWRGNHVAALREALLATGVDRAMLDPAMVVAAALDGLGRTTAAAFERAGFVERRSEQCFASELDKLP